VSQPVLMLMDYQEAICRTDGAIGRAGVGGEVERRGVLEKAARVLAAFRAHGAPVIHVRVAFDPEYHTMTSASDRFQGMRRAGLLQKHDPGTRICGEVAPTEEEPVVTKGCVNPFVGTNLAEKLNAIPHTDLVLGGVATNHVVESTARFAADSGHRVIVLEDLCASFTRELHEFAVEQILPSYARVTSSGDYLGAWHE